MDTNATELWTESAIAAAQHTANIYIICGTAIMTILVILLVMSIDSNSSRTWMHNHYHLYFGLLNWPVMYTLTTFPYLMEILVHSGLKLAGLEIIPQILPNTCELAQVVEQDGGWGMWPCVRDETSRALQENGFSVAWLWESSLGGFVSRALLWLAFYVVLGMMGDLVEGWQRSKREAKGEVGCERSCCFVQEAKMEEGEQVRGIDPDHEKKSFLI